jgi:hypothetical protein
MPLPKPHAHEDKKTFLARCYADKNVRKEFKNDNNQIGGVCYNLWERKKKKATSVIRAAGNEYISGENLDLTDAEIAEAKIESFVSTETEKIKTEAKLSLRDGIYTSLRYGNCLEVDGTIYKTVDAINLDRVNATSKMVLVKNGEVFWPVGGNFPVGWLLFGL